MARMVHSQPRMGIPSVMTMVRIRMGVLAGSLGWGKTVLYPIRATDRVAMVDEKEEMNLSTKE